MAGNDPPRTPSTPRTVPPAWSVSSSGRRRLPREYSDRLVGPYSSAGRAAAAGSATAFGSPLLGEGGKRRIDFTDRGDDDDDMGMGGGGMSSPRKSEGTTASLTAAITTPVKAPHSFATPLRRSAAPSIPFVSPGHSLPGGGGETSEIRRGEGLPVYSGRFVPSRTASNYDNYDGEPDENDDGGDTPRRRGKSPKLRASPGGAGGAAAGRGGAAGAAGAAARGGAAAAAAGAGAEAGGKAQSSQSILNDLLRVQLLGETEGGGSGGVLHFKAQRRAYDDDVKRRLALAPSREGSWQLAAAAAPGCVARKVPKVPFKVLDAPQLADDFYLSLVDWSSQNVLAVALGSSVYLWSACTSKVTKLCDVGTTDQVTSVCWTQRGSHLAVATGAGDVQLWEAATCRNLRTLPGHTGRVGAMSWNGPVLATGGRDKAILLRDARTRADYNSRLTGHRQEVCGLKWSPDGQQLASGGNDNKLLIWSAQTTSPLLRFTDHKAAVKAIAWSPHQGGLLATGGGTADMSIRFWNTTTASRLQVVDTGSQVCNLAWSKNVNEIVSTHGYSLNQVILWRYPSMSKVCTLTGHTLRVLYLAMAPDGQTIVTGAGDETLRFWNVFPGPKNKDGGRIGTSLLFPAGAEVR